MPQKRQPQRSPVPQQLEQEQQRERSLPVPPLMQNLPRARRRQSPQAPNPPSNNR